MQNDETSGGATRDDRNAGNAGGESSGSTGGATRESRTYVVQSGDTLSKIAKQYYGDANRYMDIFNANKDKLSNPDKIQPGQELVIP